MPHDQPEGYARCGKIRRQPCTGDAFDNPPLPFVRLQRLKKMRRCCVCNGFLRAGNIGDCCDTCRRVKNIAEFNLIPERFALKPGPRPQDHPTARMGTNAER